MSAKTLGGDLYDKIMAILDNQPMNAGLAAVMTMAVDLHVQAGFNREEFIEFATGIWNLSLQSRPNQPPGQA